ncbi:ABC transporter ATP-binding protein [Solwaraspora sp. WMMB335]|uniref:ABC transporter ATP-binding protein n=1 Tax=Solwaraspora sp. WMMB335 TaxID=3404118 RepID=UPI003B966A93
MSKREQALGELLRPIRGRLLLAAAVQAAAAALGVVPLVAVAHLGYEVLDPPIDRGRVVKIIIVATAALFGRLVLAVIASAVAHFAENDFQLHVRRLLVDRLGRLPLGWFGSTNSGVVKKAVQDDVDQMHHMVAHSVLELVSAAVVPLASLGYLAWVDWRMALITAAPLVVGIALYGRTGRKFMANLTSMDQETARINASAVEFVRGIAVVKTFGLSRRAYRRFAEAADAFADFFTAWVARLIGPRALSETVLSPVTVLLVVLTAGAAMIISEQLPPADLVPFLLLGGGLTAPITALTFAEQDVRAAQQAADRVVAVLSIPPLPPPANPTVPADTRIELGGVSFSYDGRTDVLSDVDLVLDPGTVTALVGQSGAGKSTLAALLPRFWDATGGSVRVGGVDVRDIPAAELYRRLAIVFQDVCLLRASVIDNIRIARPDASAEEVEAAARDAQIHDRIIRLPRGYDSIIGDETNLSGGEAQRVSIARALLADAPVIVLDEGTVYTDPDSEAAIQSALTRLAQGKTLLVIAHRLASVVTADQIVVLRDGRIVERGRHEELLVASGYYSTLWADQDTESVPVALHPQGAHR